MVSDGKAEKTHLSKWYYNKYWKGSPCSRMSYSWWKVCNSITSKRNRQLVWDIEIRVRGTSAELKCFRFLCRWKEVRHDNTVTWLAFWNDPINPKEFKYVFLAASSSLKGQSDKEKYEKARLLKVQPSCHFTHFFDTIVSRTLITSICYFGYRTIYKISEQPTQRISRIKILWSGKLQLLHISLTSWLSGLAMRR